MAPKGKSKGKKGKGGDSDEEWERKLADKSSAVATPAAEDAEEENEAPIAAPARAGGFGALDIADGADDDDDGGFMASLNKAKSRKKNKPVKAAPPPESEDEAPKRGGFGALADEDEDLEPVAPVKKSKKDKKSKKSAPADDEYELPPVDEPAPAVDEPAPAPEPVAAKKGKAGKKGKKQAVTEDDWDLPEPTPAAEVTAATPAQAAEQPPAVVEEDAADDGDEAATTGVLSKAQKEKLKKEREKAKKKAQAAAKKAAAGPTAPQPDEAAPQPTPEAPSTEPAADDDAADDAGETGAASKSKKKKKKAAAATPAPEPEKKPTKANARLEALRAAMEAQKAAEEAAKKAAEEERLRLEEEERKRAEAEKAIEDARLRKKEREKAKKEQLKKEGKLLTPKQKAEQAAAIARREALLASGGVQVAALSNSAPREKPKKEKKAVVEKPVETTPAAQPAPAPVKPLPAVDDVKDSWDEPEAEPATKEDVADDWDASDSEPEAPAATPAAAPQANGRSAAIEVAKPKPNGVAQPKLAAPKAAAAAAATAESSSEEDSDEDSSEEDSDEDSSDDEETRDERREREEAERKEEARLRRERELIQAKKQGNKDDLRSPICCILGHVDTGKTKLLDKIRQTNVQEGEAGGITQQIGATFFPMDAVKRKTAVLKDDDVDYKMPGLLVIDTPGHESFSNLRSRGSSLCNIAILVVDIMHGLEPQTLESLRMLRDKKTPFVVALNKIDRMYGWDPTPDGGFQQSLEKQNKGTQSEYKTRLANTITAFAEQGLNALPYYENKNFARNVSLVPTSAHTGEGIPDLLMLLVKLTQERMTDRLMYLSALECTVLEVKVEEGLGHTLDVVLSNGILREGDRIVCCGINGGIATTVRALLTPQPLKELRIRGSWVHHKMVKAALGVKIVAPDLEKAVAGSRLLLVGPEDDEEDLKEEIMSDLTGLLDSVDRTKPGVYVQASTLGSLEALLDFLKSDAVKIPVSQINIGPVHKKDVTRAMTQLEKAPEYALMLCFDVAIDKDAEALAEREGVKVFKAEIIYHLFDKFLTHMKEVDDAKKKDSAPKAVWPCRLKVLKPFLTRDPILLGCDIIEGSLRIGTPLCVVKTETDPTTKKVIKREIVKLGRVTGLEINRKPLEIVQKSQVGSGVAVKIEHAVYESAKMFGRHFDANDELLSLVSRESIDVLKNVFRKEVTNDEWKLIVELKKRLDVT